MIREPFIRATEIWLPSPDGKNIDLSGGLYGTLDYFAAISRGMRFAYGEGLPGRTWKAGHPVVLRDLGESWFHRRDAAMTEGLSCAVSIPCFTSGQLRAVVVLFCGDDRYSVGALELWSLADDGAGLALVDGYFGRAVAFERASRATRFARGVGLPGRVWEHACPEILADIGLGERFVRREAADRVGINRAIGIPCKTADGKPWVLTCLSARSSPIAGRFEHWRSHPEHGFLRFVDGYCESGMDLGARYQNAVIGPSEGVIARACRKGIPLVDEDLATDTMTVVALSAVEAGLRSMAVIPLGKDTSGHEDVIVLFF